MRKLQCSSAPEIYDDGATTVRCAIQQGYAEYKELHCSTAWFAARALPTQGDNTKA
jgi:LSD1 subclass zinc finger protein